MNQTLKQTGDIVLVVSHRTKYGFLKSGRGTVKCETRYSVQYTVERQLADENLSGVYGIRTKAEANKIFKLVCKHGFGALAHGVA